MKRISDIRDSFLGYFAKNGHTTVPSSPLVPHNDPTLMFVNAGMVPFKNYFTGAEKAPYPRATSSQKCVRAGGKHNDLDNVGYTARHHTFFEMLGNFSFGDYFKEQAIVHAWEMLIQDFGLAKDKLTVTVHPTDAEARALWKKIASLSDDRIIDIKDNIWMMGPTGPCGPNSEIFYDHGAQIPGGPPGSPDEDGDRFVEIYNLVFMQYEQVDENTRINLPKPSVDTGMGLERIAAVMQGTHDNYDTDLFRTLIGASEQLTSTKAQGEQKASHRVIADHLRASCFLIADGVLPSNEGRGYVLRRIMRRAMRHVHLLGSKEPLMYRLVPTLIALMGEAYPELKRAEAFVTENLKLEEERFKTTLDRGLKLLEEETDKVAKGGKLAGDVAFKLYDTYGFPLDLTQDILRGQGKTVDTDSFDAAMQQQRERARAAWTGSGEKATGKIWFDIKEKVGPTEFLGYTQENGAAKLLAIVVDGKETQSAAPGQEAQLVFNQTPFYGESGGQVGDQGRVHIGKKLLAQVLDVQKPLDGFHVHHVKLADETLKVGDMVDLHIDSARRSQIRANHSATHILHAVLRKKLGEHITQKGSLVGPDKLRFDISHPKGLSREEIADIEREVNRIIWQNRAVETRLMTPDEAIKQGAMALFGEKYGDEVRVLSMGNDEHGGNYSTELCGGTHVHATGDIGLFKITSESAVAAGVRRIEAITQGGAFAYLNEQDARIRDLAGNIKVQPEELGARIELLMNERKKLEKDLAETKKKLALGGGNGGAPALATETVGSITFVHGTLSLPAKDLRDVANEQIKKHASNAIIAIGSDHEDKAAIIIAVSKDATAKFNAAELIKPAVEAVGGKGGGGRPEMAQGGGPDAAKLNDAIAQIKARLTI